MFASCHLGLFVNVENLEMKVKVKGGATYEFIRLEMKVQVKGTRLMN